MKFYEQGTVDQVVLSDATDDQPPLRETRRTVDQSVLTDETFDQLLAPEMLALVPLLAAASSPQPSFSSLPFAFLV